MDQLLHSTPLLLDIALCVILLAGVIIGAKKGLLCSMLGVIIFVAAFVGASWCSNQLTEPVTNWVQPKVEQRIVEKMGFQPAPEATSMGGLDLSALGLGDLPLDKLDLNGLGGRLKDLLTGAKATGETMLSGAIRQIVTQVVHAALFLVAFLALLLVLWLITRPLKLATYVSAFKMVDTVGGGFLGLIGGIIAAFVAAWVARKLGLISADAVAQTHIVRRFLSGEILSGLMNLGR